MYNITELTVNGEDKVVSCKWTYTNDDGYLGGEFKFNSPAGEVQLNDIDKATLIMWLKDQMQNTEEQFIEALAQYKQNQEYAATLRQIPVPE